MEGDEKLPEGWIQVKSKSRSNKFYFHNAKLKLSLWKIEDLHKFQKNLVREETNGVKLLKQPTPINHVAVGPRIPTVGVSDKSKNVKKNVARDRMATLQKVLSQEIKRDKNETSKTKLRSDPGKKPVKKLDLFKDIVIVKENPTKDKKNVASNRMKSLNEKLSNELKEENRNSNNDLLTSFKATVPTKSESEIKPQLKHDIKHNQESEVENMDISFEEPSEELLTEYESMDWEEIPEQVVITQVHKIRTTETSSKATSLVTKEASGLPRAIDFYIIVDTNVLLSNIDFVKDIKGKIFKDIGKATIYLPYIVLCELDKLKTYNDNVAKLARRAITFIDDCFRLKDTSLVGQSALERIKKQIIPVDSGDDEILNCCLQILETTKKIILLTNDKNLRNKAFLNHLSSYSRDMLYLIDFNMKNDIKFE